MTDNAPRKKKEGSLMLIMLIMIASLAIAFYWDKALWIKNAVHAVLDPSAGALLSWNLTWGMLVIVFLITLATTLIQKYTTDQKALKDLRDEQKILQAEMKKFQNDPTKVSELSKKQFEFIPKTMKLTSRGILFTGVPFILLFRWFGDFFDAMTIANNNVAPVFFGFITWFWFYFIFAIVFSSFLRKWLKVV